MLKQALGVEAALVVGRPGEFTVWVDEKADDIVDDVREALSLPPR